jgi:hypothetical protein
MNDLISIARGQTKTGLRTEGGRPKWQSTSPTESVTMYVFIIIAVVFLVPMAWFWHKWFWSKPTFFKRMPARTWPPNRSKTVPKPRYIVPF